MYDSEYTVVFWAMAPCSLQMLPTILWNIHPPLPGIQLGQYEVGYTRTMTLCRRQSQKPHISYP